MPEGISEIPNGDHAALLRQIRERGKHQPGVIIAVTCGDRLMLVNYAKHAPHELTLPQGKIPSALDIDEATWAILTQEFGITLPRNNSDEWKEMVTVLDIYHQNFMPRGAMGEGKRAKAMFAIHVRLPSTDVNLNTEWNSYMEPNPPIQVVWVGVTSANDLLRVRNQYLLHLPTKGKCDAETAIIAKVFGINYELEEAA